MLRETRTIAQLEAQLVDVEAQISLLRAEQHVLVNELDRAQAPQIDASRSMVDWIQAHLDVRRDTARDLVFAARRFGHHRGLHSRMLRGNATFDRTVAAVKLADAGATQREVEESYQRDLAGVARMLGYTKHITSHDERQVFADRFFTIQPNLDESRYRMWGEAPGGLAVRSAKLSVSVLTSSTGSQAIYQRRGDNVSWMPSLRWPRTPLTTQVRRSPPHPKSLCSLTPAKITRPRPRRRSNTDPASDRTPSNKYCGTGRVRVVGLDTNGVPVVTSPLGRSIPVAIRHTVAHRDGVCVIDGCTSRFTKTVTASTPIHHPYVTVSSEYHHAARTLLVV